MLSTFHLPDHYKCVGFFFGCLIFKLFGEYGTKVEKERKGHFHGIVLSKGGGA